MQFPLIRGGELCGILNISKALFDRKIIIHKKKGDKS